MLVDKDYGDLVVRMAAILNHQYGDEISKYDLDGEPGAHRVAYSIVEICESAEKMANILNILRKTNDGQSDVPSCDFIQFLRDEIEHLVYHIKDSGVFSDIISLDQD